jgi:hypothetical protein
MMMFVSIVFSYFFCLVLPTETAAFAPSVQPDWVEAELTVLKFPSEPSPDLSAEQVAVACLRSLQLTDHPEPNAGLERIYPFLTIFCRDGVTARGVETVEEFCERGALSPVLQTFMGATKIDLVGEGTLSKGTATRGDIMSFPVQVTRAAVSAFQHKSGLIRDRVASAPATHEMVIRLEKGRRPPVAGCWLVREITDGQYAKGGQGWSRDEGV